MIFARTASAASSRPRVVSLCITAWSCATSRFFATSTAASYSFIMKVRYFIG